MASPSLGSKASVEPLSTPRMGRRTSRRAASRSSSSSYRSLSSTPSGTPRRSSSTITLLSRADSFASSSSIPFVDGEVETITEEGLRHADYTLQARRYRTRPFAEMFLQIIAVLKVPSWMTLLSDILPEQLKIHKVSGSLTNAVFFVSYPPIASVKTVLLRIYGPSSSVLISRPRELHALYVLSSQYHIGPRIYGTFENGRVEEYFDSETLTVENMRDPQISRWIGARMAELHCVDVEAIEGTRDWEIAAIKNVRSWSEPAREVLRLPAVEEALKQQLDFERFLVEWERYITWLEKWELKHGASKRVFAHNDAQCGNLLRLSKLEEGMPDHRQIIVVDFEYASPNPAAFDMANHFHEWTADYLSSTPHIMKAAAYPTEQERKTFYKAYLAYGCPPFETADDTPMPPQAISSSAEDDVCLDVGIGIRRLEAQVRVWSPASHAMWAVWGIVQAREDLELSKQAVDNGVAPEEPEFNYLGYAICRMEGFRREIKCLGL